MKKLGDKFLIDDMMSAKAIWTELWQKVVLWIFVVVFILGGVLVFHLARVDEERRLYVVTFLQSLDDNAAVYVDGQTADNRDDIIVALQTLWKGRPHGSHPVERFQVVIEGGEKQLKLILGRDSDKEREYWVYLVDEFPAEKELYSDNGRIGIIDDMDIPIQQKGAE